VAVAITVLSPLKERCACARYNMPRALVTASRVRSLRHPACARYGIPRAPATTGRVRPLQHAACARYNMPRALATTCRVLRPECCTLPLEERQQQRA
jgi:hypothetical protein